MEILIPAILIAIFVTFLITRALHKNTLAGDGTAIPFREPTEAEIREFLEKRANGEG